MKITVFKFLWPYFCKLRLPLAASLACILFGEAFSRFGMYYGSKVIGLISSDPANRYSILSQALVYIFIYGLLMALRGVIANFAMYIDAHFIPSLQARVYKNLFTVAHKHSPEYFEQEMSGNISSKIENIVTVIEKLYYSISWGIIQPVVVLIITCTAIALVKPSLALILFMLIIVFVWLMYKSSRFIMPYVKETTHTTSLANGELIDSLINADTVKSFGRRFYENQFFFKKLIKSALAERRELNASGWIYIFQSCMRSLIQVFFCVIPLIYWYKEQITLVEFVFIQSLIISLINVFSSAIDLFLKIFSFYSIIQDGLNLLYKPYQVKDKPNAVLLEVSKGAIDFERISFAYPELPTLFDDFSLKIKPQQKIGLVGCSGSGKSTLIKLLNRYYNLNAGSIKIDGQDITDVTDLSLHRHIAMIPQEPNLFNRTIMENIRYGNLNATDEEVYEAAKKAYCHDFILALPNGYNSKVGERGVMLSGGERQRIAIARAILKDAPILVLDEATSALDSESESFIQASLANLMQGKTVIAVAHRLSTLKKMDKIIVLDKGKISEEGTHSQLLRRQGIYHKFYYMQTSSFKK